jgi:hypothetical protein
MESAKQVRNPNPVPHRLCMIEVAVVGWLQVVQDPGSSRSGTQTYAAEYWWSKPGCKVFDPASRLFPNENATVVSVGINLEH